MRIGMIGAGSVSSAVARQAIGRGHHVLLSDGSGAERLADVVARLGSGTEGGTVAEAAQADIVLLAVPWTQVGSALSGLPGWGGRILIDATNPFARTRPKLVLADLEGRGASEIVAGLAPGARVVKAFNSITMASFEAGPTLGDARRVLFVSGDHTDAKATVKNLVESFGFACIDLGGLKAGGRLQQAGGPLAGRDILVMD